MTEPLSDLQKRIADLKAETQPIPTPESVSTETEGDKQGLGAAYELIMTPIVCGGIGVGLDKLFSTSPAFFITLAVLGLLAGFWRIYRLSQNILTPLDLKRLQEAEKQGRKTQISENNTE
jgi:F0F1-type ATP synthase assembly protein I